MVKVSYTTPGGNLTATFTDGNNGALPNVTSSLSPFKFGGKVNVKNVIIDNTFTEINSLTFLNAKYITSIRISNTVKKISETAFDTNKLLSQIIVDYGNSFFTSKDGVLIAKGPALFRYPPAKISTNYDIPDYIKTISNNAFKNIGVLTEDIGFGGKVNYVVNTTNSLITLKIPASVISIDINAFYGVSLLTEIIVANNNPTYKSINGVLFTRDNITLIKYPENKNTPDNTYNIPDGVKNFYPNAFSGTFSLSKINIPASVTNIDIKSFDKSYALTEINVDINNQTYYSENGILFSKDKTVLKRYPRNNPNKNYTIPTFVRKIDDNAFSFGSHLSSLTISNGTTIIGNNAFGHCTKLTSVSISASVINIADDAFQYSTDLTKFTVDPANTVYSTDSFGVLFKNDLKGDKIKQTLIQYPIGNNMTNYSVPNTITKINNLAFTLASFLTTLFIPASVILIGDTINKNVFFSISALTSITVDNNNTKYSSDEFGVLFSKDKTLLLQYPGANERTKYAVPTTVKTINDSAFYNAKYLTTIFIPENVTTIGPLAFMLTGRLKNINIPSSVTSIQPTSFLYTWELEVVYIEIPNKLNLTETTDFFSYSMNNVTIQIRPASFTSDFTSSDSVFSFNYILYITGASILVIGIIIGIIFIIKKNKK